VEAFFVGVETWLEGLGPLAVVLAPIIMAAVSVLPIPAEAPAMVNGMLFGPVLGTTLTFIGAMAGAQLSFELARLLGRPLVERFVRPSALQGADRVVSKAGWGGLLIARLIPVIAFTALNWGAGLTSVPRWRFFWTTGLGILPGAIVFTVFGATLPSLLQESPLLTAVGLVVLIAAIAAGAYWTRHLDAEEAAEAVGMDLS